MSMCRRLTQGMSICFDRNAASTFSSMNLSSTSVDPNRLPVCRCSASAICICTSSIRFAARSMSPRFCRCTAFMVVETDSLRDRPPGDVSVSAEEQSDERKCGPETVAEEARRRRCEEESEGRLDPWKTRPALERCRLRLAALRSANELAALREEPFHDGDGVAKCDADADGQDAQQFDEPHS